MQIIAFDTDIKSDGRGTAPITWIAIELLQSTVSDYSIWYVSSGSGSGVLRKHYLENVLPKIPSNVRSAIVAVDKTYLDGTTKTSTSTISDTIWAPSMREWEAASRNETTGVEYPLWVRTVKRLNGVASKWALRSCWLNSYGGRDGVYVRDTASDLVGSGVLGVSVGVCLCFCT